MSLLFFKGLRCVGYFLAGSGFLQLFYSVTIGSSNIASGDLRVWRLFAAISERKRGTPGRAHAISGRSDPLMPAEADIPQEKKKYFAEFCRFFFISYILSASTRVFTACVINVKVAVGRGAILSTCR